MKTYKMTVSEIVARHYFIEAESEEDARNWRGEVTDMKTIWCEEQGIEDVEEVS